MITTLEDKESLQFVNEFLKAVYTSVKAHNARANMEKKISKFVFTIAT